MSQLTIKETNKTLDVHPGSPDATSIDGTPVDAASPSSGDVLRYDGSGWSVKAEADLDPTSLDASDLTTGSIPDARVPESAVTQHEPFNADQLQGETLPSSPSDGELLRYNGTQWEHVTELLDKGAGTFNANHPAYGADPSETKANNRTAIESALNDAASSGGVAEVTKPGTYLVERATGNATDHVFQITSSDVMLRLGPGVTIKLADGEVSAGGDTVNMVRIGDGTSAISNIAVVGGGTIDMNESSNTSDGPIAEAAVYVNGPVDGVLLENIDVNNALRQAVGVEGESGSSRAKNIVCVDVDIDNPAEGVQWVKCDNFVWKRGSIKNARDQDLIEPAGNTSYWWVLNATLDTPASDNSAVDIFPGNGNDTEHGHLIGCTVLHGVVRIAVASGTAAGDGVARDITLDDNYLEGGFFFYGGTGKASRLTISNNDVVGQITVSDPASPDIYHYQIEDEPELDCVTIVGNYSENADGGAYIVGGRGAFAGFNIARNPGMDDTVGSGNRFGFTMACDDGVCIGNRVFDDGSIPSGSPAPVKANGDRNQLGFNRWWGPNIGTFQDNGASTAFVGQGLQVDQGTATIPSGDTSVNVTINLPANNWFEKHCIVTPQNAEAGARGATADRATGSKLEIATGDGQATNADAVYNYQVLVLDDAIDGWGGP